MEESVEIFPWHKYFATGISEIDEQHQRLVHLLNKLAGRLTFQTDLLDLTNAFKEMEDYAGYHFNTEEAVWHQFLAGDKWENEHKKSHQSFVSDISKLKNKESIKPFDEVIEEVLSFLTNWLLLHILDSDKRMAMVVLALQSGLSLEQAKQHATQNISGETEDVIETMISMNDKLTTRTLQFMKQVMERRRVEVKFHPAANDIENNLASCNLTGREREIMMLVVGGYSSKEIANNLAISFRTVDVHRSRIMKKTGASNLIELARISRGT